MANVLAALPKSTHPAATKAMQEILNAEDGEHARVAAKAFAVDYGAKFGKAVAKIIDNLDVLLAFYDYPAEHWIHLRTTNPLVILSRTPGGPGDLGVCVEDGVHDVVVQWGSRVAGSGRVGVSRRGSVRRSPRASARAWRSRWLAASSWRMRWVAICRR